MSSSLSSHRPKLIVTRGGARPEQIDLNDQILLGRAEDSDLVLLDETASRRHAEIVRDGEGFVLKDLGSANGTRVNGETVRERLLRGGDEISVGSVRMVCSLRSADAPTKVEIDPESEPLQVERTIAAETFDPTDGEDREELLRRLKTLYRVHGALSRSLRVDDLLAEILRSVADILPLERGAIWIGSSGRLQPGAFLRRSLDGAANQDPFEVSSALIDRVLRSEAGILVRDVARESTLRERTSVLESPTVSAAAVPLLAEGTARGVLYLDSARKDAFTPEDLELLLGLAFPAALALRNAESYSRTEREAVRLRREILSGQRIVGQSAAIEEVLGQIRKIAPTEATVLIQGETGTGKELIARELHSQSKRSRGPFVAVNCAALSPGLLESELFGHRKGAFTGAVRDAPGQFRLADGGTLLLDEVGELPLDLQSKLLRALEEREVRPVGGDEPVPVDLRILAATNRDLKASIGEGVFREDLYFRLGVVRLRIPPLRERAGDIRHLVDHFLAEAGRRRGGGPSRVEEGGLAMLEAYDWPGNIRELRNVIERASILSSGETIRSEDLPGDLLPPDAAPRSPADEKPLSLREAERQAIEAALIATGGKKGEAAKILGISWPTLTKKIRDYGLASPPGN